MAQKRSAAALGIGLIHCGSFAVFEVFVVQYGAAVNHPGRSVLPKGRFLLGGLPTLPKGEGKGGTAGMDRFSGLR